MRKTQYNVFRSEADVGGKSRGRAGCMSRALQLVLLVEVELIRTAPRIAEEMGVCLRTAKRWLSAYHEARRNVTEKGL
jgi:hypothetical protein